MKRPLTVLAAAAVMALGNSAVYAQGVPAPTPIPPTATAPVAPGPAPAPVPVVPAPAAPVFAPAPATTLAAPSTQGTPGESPTTPGTGAVPTPVLIDPKVQTFLDSVQAKLKSIKSLSAEATNVMTYTVPGRTSPPPMHSISDVKLMRPNFARVSNWEQALDPKDGKWHRSKQSLIQAADGKNYWLWMGFNNQYIKSPIDASGSTISLGALEGLNGFFNDVASISMELKTFADQHVLNSVDLKADQTWNGEKYSVVEISFTVPLPASMLKAVPSGKLALTEDLYIGDDLLVHRALDSCSIFNEETVYDPIRIDSLTDKTAFAFTLPAGAKPRTAAAAEPTEPPVLKNGVKAPDFTVQDTNGKPLKLSSYHGKVVVIDFWATWCGPCQESLPHTNAVAEKFKGKNVVFLAVNTSDTPDAFKSWLPQHKAYDALVFAIDSAPPDTNIASTLYHVSGIPTQFVIDKTGVVKNSFVGYGGPTDDLENAVKAAGG